MEHVFSPEELQEYAGAIPQIPWLGYEHEPSTNLSSFDDYALQRGWTESAVQNLRNGEFSRLEKISLVPFLQSWFSFGLLESALGKAFAIQDFIVLKDSQPHFTTEPLRSMGKDLETRYENAPNDDVSKVEDMKRFVLVLKAASTWCRILCADRFVSNNEETYDASFHSVLRMFALLGLTVQYTAQYLVRFMAVNTLPQLQNSWGYTLMMRDDLRARMVRRGWCPYIQTMMHPYSLIAVEYAAAVGPPSDHFDHQQCSRTACTVHNIDESTYKPLHNEADCTCPFVRPSLQRIEEILRGGQIPVVDLSSISDENGFKKIDVLPFEPEGTPFCAVSHVWSGGLGSWSEQGLPECALIALQQYILPPGDTNPIWIDSLCIPHEKSLRKISIHRMNNVYSQARTTLVIDPGLIRTPMPSPKKMLLWLTTSAWMQRMWTLPEGRLSQNAFIASSNGAKRIVQLIAEAQQEWTNPVIGALEPDLLALYGIKSIDLRAIHQSLCYRTTSKREDETPALAALFNIDPSTILNTASLDDRMALFWRAVGQKVIVPTNILFLGGRKLHQHPGLRWAPQTLLNVGPEVTLIRPPAKSTEYNIRIGEDGSLTGMYPVIKLHKTSSVSLTQYNPIRVYLLPDETSQATMYGDFTISPFDAVAVTGGDETVQQDEIHDVDAFALNLWNREATTRPLLVQELTATNRSAVALTTEAGPETSHLFKYIDRLSLLPLESTGREMLVGTLGWTEITIS